MALTQDRPEWTASQLNAVWSDLIKRLAPQLPYAIRVNKSGSKIDDLGLDETDTEAESILEPFDVLNALVKKGADNGLGTWNGFYDTEVTLYKLEVRESIVDRQSLDTDSILFDTFNVPELIAFVYMQISGTTITYTSDKEVTNTSDGWTTSNLRSQEDFEGSGFNEWDIGESSVRGLTEDFQDYHNVGYEYFDTGKGYLLTIVEEFDVGDWPTGVVPPTESSTYRTTDISSQVDGTRTTFTIPAYDTSNEVNLRVYYNGQRLTTGNDVTILTSTTFSMTFAPKSATELVVDYKPQ
jgi:hypothetical protein